MNRYHTLMVMGSSERELRLAFDETRGLFIALGDKYRQDILLILGADHATSVKELSDQLGLSRPATSHHLKILKEAGLLGERIVGVRTYYYPVITEPFRLVKRLVELVETHDGLIGPDEVNNTKGEA